MTQSGAGLGSNSNLNSRNRRNRIAAFEALSREQLLAERLNAQDWFNRSTRNLDKKEKWRNQLEEIDAALLNQSRGIRTQLTPEQRQSREERVLQNRQPGARMSREQQQRQQQLEFERQLQEFERETLSDKAQEALRGVSSLSENESARRRAADVIGQDQSVFQMLKGGTEDDALIAELDREFKAIDRDAYEHFYLRPDSRTGTNPPSRPNIATPQGEEQYKNILRAEGIEESIIEYRIESLKSQGINDPIGESLRQRAGFNMLGTDDSARPNQNKRVRDEDGVEVTRNVSRTEPASYRFEDANEIANQVAPSRRTGTRIFDKNPQGEGGTFVSYGVNGQVTERISTDAEFNQRLNQAKALSEQGELVPMKRVILQDGQETFRPLAPGEEIKSFKTVASDQGTEAAVYNRRGRVSENTSADLLPKVATGSPVSAAERLVQAVEQDPTFADRPVREFLGEMQQRAGITPESRNYINPDTLNRNVVTVGDLINKLNLSVNPRRQSRDRTVSLGDGREVDFGNIAANRSVNQRMRQSAAEMNAADERHAAGIYSQEELEAIARTETKNQLEAVRDSQRQFDDDGKLQTRKGRKVQGFGSNATGFEGADEIRQLLGEEAPTPLVSRMGPVATGEETPSSQLSIDPEVRRAREQRIIEGIPDLVGQSVPATADDVLALEGRRRDQWRQAGLEAYRIRHSDINSPAVENKQALVERRGWHQNAIAPLAEERIWNPDTQLFTMSDVDQVIQPQDRRRGHGIAAIRRTPDVVGLSSVKSPISIETAKREQERGEARLAPGFSWEDESIRSFVDERGETIAFPRGSDGMPALTEEQDWVGRWMFSNDDDAFGSLETRNVEGVESAPGMESKNYDAISSLQNASQVRSVAVGDQLDRLTGLFNKELTSRNAQPINRIETIEDLEGAVKYLRQTGDYLLVHTPDTSKPDTFIQNGVRVNHPTVEQILTNIGGKQGLRSVEQVSTVATALFESSAARTRQPIPVVNTVDSRGRKQRAIIRDQSNIVSSLPDDLVQAQARLRASNPNVGASRLDQATVGDDQIFVSGDKFDKVQGQRLGGGETVPVMQRNTDGKLVFARDNKGKVVKTAVRGVLKSKNPQSILDRIKDDEVAKAEGVLDNILSKELSKPANEQNILLIQELNSPQARENARRAGLRNAEEIILETSISSLATDVARPNIGVEPLSSDEVRAKRINNILDGKGANEGLNRRAPAVKSKDGWRSMSWLKPDQRVEAAANAEVLREWGAMQNPELQPAMQRMDASQRFDASLQDAQQRTMTPASVNPQIPVGNPREVSDAIFDIQAADRNRQINMARDLQELNQELPGLFVDDQWGPNPNPVPSETAMRNVQRDIERGRKNEANLKPVVNDTITMEGNRRRKVDRPGNPKLGRPDTSETFDIKSIPAGGVPRGEAPRFRRNVENIASFTQTPVQPIQKAVVPASMAPDPWAQDAPSVVPIDLQENRRARQQEMGLGGTLEAPRQRNVRGFGELSADPIASESRTRAKRKQPSSYQKPVTDNSTMRGPGTLEGRLNRRAFQAEEFRTSPKYRNHRRGTLGALLGGGALVGAGSAIGSESERRKQEEQERRREEILAGQR